MVKHIIIWKLKSEFNNDEIKGKMKSSLEALKGEISGLLEIKVFTEPMLSSNADVMLYSAFENEEAYKGYLVHEKHVAAADNYVRPFVEARSCFDCVD